MRKQLLLWLVPVTALGIGSKLYTGPGHGWVRSYGGGVLYVVFWILVAAWIWPRARPSIIAAIVVGATCAIEALQLWHPPALEAVRSTWLGHALLGSTFSWWDLPHYVLGGLLGASLRASLGVSTEPLSTKA